MFVDAAITTMSSKGQLVIPKDMRENLRKGDKILLIKKEGIIIMQKVDELDAKLREDLEFAKRTEEAWQRIERGESKRMTAEEFLEELDKW